MLLIQRVPSSLIIHPKEIHYAKLVESFYGHKGPQRKVPLLVQFMEILKVSGHYGFESRASTFFDCRKRGELTGLNPI